MSDWKAAIADFGVAILVWIPERVGVTETVYPMSLASVVIFSWIVLFIVADRKPLERRWILIPTILVVALLAFAKTTFSLSGTIEFNIALPLFAIALIIFMAYSYYYAGKYDTSK